MHSTRVPANIERNFADLGDTRLSDERIVKTGRGEQVVQLPAADHVETERGAELIAMREELPRIERELGKLLTAIKAGGPIQAIVDDMKRLEARKLELNEGLENANERHPLELMLGTISLASSLLGAARSAAFSSRFSQVDKHRDMLPSAQNRISRQEASAAPKPDPEIIEGGPQCSRSNGAACPYYPECP